MTRVRQLLIASLVLASALATACTTHPLDPSRSCVVGTVCVRGTVAYATIEGGFWVIQGDDGVTYDPTAELPTPVRHVGQRVYMVGTIRGDLNNFQMAGPLVDLILVNPIR